MAATATAPHFPPGPRPQLDELEAAWDAFFSAIRRARSRAQQGDEPASLTLSQYHLLAGLLDAPQLPVGELACAAGISAPTATRAIDALVKRGLVQRAHCATDRRCVMVSLTPEGTSALRTKRTAVRRKRAALFASLEPSERRQAQRLLVRLADAVDTL